MLRAMRKMNLCSWEKHLPAIDGAWATMILQAMKERRFARQAIKRLLKAHSAVSTTKPDLSGKELYKEVLLRAQQIDEAYADMILRRAENSIDEWTAPGRPDLQFRDVVHYFVFQRYIETGRAGTTVSLRTIVDALVPSDI